MTIKEFWDSEIESALGNYSANDKENPKRDTDDEKSEVYTKQEELYRPVLNL